MRAEKRSAIADDATTGRRGRPAPHLGALALAGTLAVLAAVALARPAAAGQPAELVQAYVARFNSRDLDALLALAHPDVEWLTVSGAEITVETRGRDALRASLTSYFASCASCRSTVEVYQVVGPLVSTVEHAEWQSRSGEPKRQSSLAVYELDGGLVRRVWYFAPAAASPQTSATPAP